MKINLEKTTLNEQALREIATANIAGLARICLRDWKNVYFGAVPYLRAMRDLDNMQSVYGQENSRGIVLYFLSNASTWRGEVAKAVKAELKRRLGE